MQVIYEDLVVQKLWPHRSLSTDRQGNQQISKFKFLDITRHVFLKQGCPLRQQSQNMAKTSKSYILTPPNPQGHVMSVKREEPIDKLTVQVWLLYHNPILKYCTLFVSGTELQTDRLMIRLLDAPGEPIRPGA